MREAGLKKVFFRPFGSQFGLKIRGGSPWRPPLDLPLYHAGSHTLSLYLFFIPFHSRPAHSFLWYTSPFKTFKFIIWRNINKCYLLKILFCIFLALLIFLFVYSIPVSDLVFKERYSVLQFTLWHFCTSREI